MESLLRLHALSLSDTQVLLNCVLAKLLDPMQNRKKSAMNHMLVVAAENQLYQIANWLYDIYRTYITPPARKTTVA